MYDAQNQLKKLESISVTLVPKNLSGIWLNSPRSIVNLRSFSKEIVLIVDTSQLVRYLYRFS